MKNYVPDEFRFSHDYCFFLHDLLAEIIVIGEQAGIFEHAIQFQDEAVASDFRLKSGEDLFDWLETRGFDDDLDAIIFKHITVAMLSDFCHFVFEALDCSAKGKLTVTFALLRKPLKENLFYFEWMLADRDDFLKRFRARVHSQKKRPLPLPTRLSKQQRIDTIGNALEKTTMGKWIDSDFIYELRYDKDCDYGFEKLFQRAIHLITTFTAPTEEQNFNFIFTGEPEREVQWEGLYSFLPVLLFHATQVITAVICTFAPRFFDTVFAFADSRTQLGLLLWMQDAPWNVQLDKEMRDVRTKLQETGIKCLNCQARLDLSTNGSMRQLYWEGGVSCSHCDYFMQFTTDVSALFFNHLQQGKVNCPECNEEVELNEQNVELFLDRQTVSCQRCQSEIEIALE